ncbi:hypothetical protein Pyn_19919 [Prunus yedoensis var. nudiflora]|uniref:Uncharacterized protein n=1 Tax=Prunus yedoensis var. nudiflora TaxID=2094558 RepID=A0A314Z2I5_PRUYE|nr:hypothetical protein Pyn_19919 [Prunus yedoensis var. nudiflora]
MRLSTITPTTKPIATTPPVPMPPLPVAFELGGALGLEVFEVGAGGEACESGVGASLFTGGGGDDFGGEFEGEGVG